MIRNGKSSRTSAPSKSDKRLEVMPGREDDLQPFGRKGGGIDSVAKGGLIGHDSGGSSYRWIAQLGGEADLNRPYAQHPYIYACVAAIGRAASSVPARMQRREGGEFVTVEDTTLSNVLDFPNPLQSQRKFFRSICTSQQLYGETFLILLKKGANGQMVPVDAVGGTAGMMALIEEPEEVWPVRGDLVEAMLDPKTKLPAMWRFSTAAGHVDYPAHAIVKIAEVNPYNPLRGMGPMQAAYRTASKDFIIDRYDEALLQNGGSPGGVLTVDGPLTDADQRAIREAWQEAHGRPESHRKTAVLPQGTIYKEIGMTPQAMEHEKLRKWDRTTILSMFGVPPVVLGLETMNYATAREQNRIFWETTVLPYLDFLKDEIQYKLIKRINSPVSELLLDFDISSVSALREDMDAKVDRTIKLYAEGHRTFIEAARLSGWDIDEETLEGGDERWLPGTLVQPGMGELESDGYEEEVPVGTEEAGEEERALGVDGVDLLGTDKALDDNTVGSSPWPPHLSTEEGRYNYWKLYTMEEEDTIDRLNKKTHRVMRDMLLAARKRIREVAKEDDWSLVSSAPEGEAKNIKQPIYTEAEIYRLLALDVTPWGEDMAGEMAPILMQLMLQSAASMAEELGEEVPTLDSINDEFLIDFYRDYPVFLALGPASTRAMDISRMVLKVLLNSDVGGVGGLAESIHLTMRDQELGITHLMKMLPDRVDRISRTETNTAHNAARVEQMRRGSVGSHIWLSSRDNRVRETHQLVDGEQALVGELFSNGVMYPGQPGGAPPQEIINCRCTTIPVLR